MKASEEKKELYRVSNKEEGNTVWLNENQVNMWTGMGYNVAKIKKEGK